MIGLAAAAAAIIVAGMAWSPRCVHGAAITSASLRDLSIPSAALGCYARQTAIEVAHTPRAAFYLSLPSFL